MIFTLEGHLMGFILRAKPGRTLLLFRNAITQELTTKWADDTYLSYYRLVCPD